MTSIDKAIAASAEQVAYHFCVVFTLRCQHHQVLVGKNMMPPQHLFPKAPWPERWVSLPWTLGIWSTDLPVPQESALIWWPDNSQTAWGHLLFLHKLVWTKLTISGRMGVLNTAGKGTFFPGDSPFSEHTDIRGWVPAMVRRGEGHTPLNLAAPTGKAGYYNISSTVPGAKH